VGSYPIFRIDGLLSFNKQTKPVTNAFMTYCIEAVS